MDRTGRGDDGNDGVGDAACGVALGGGRVFESGEVADGKHLRGEKAIEPAEAEGAAAAQEVGDMRGLEAGLPGEDCPIYAAAIDPPEDFQAEPLLQLGEVHCGKLASR